MPQIERKTDQAKPDQEPVGQDISVDPCLAAGGDEFAALGAMLGLGFGLVCLRIIARRRLNQGLRIYSNDLPQGDTP